MVVDDLFEDMKDGVKLLALLEVLSGQKLVRMLPVTRLVQLFLLGIRGCRVGSVRCAIHIMVCNTRETLVYQSLLRERNKGSLLFLHTCSRFKTLFIVVATLEVNIKNFISNLSWLTTPFVCCQGRSVAQ